MVFCDLIARFCYCQIIFLVRVCHSLWYIPLLKALVIASDLLATVNKAAVSTCVQVFTWIGVFRSLRSILPDCMVSLFSLALVDFTVCDQIMQLPVGGLFNGSVLVGSWDCRDWNLWIFFSLQV